MDWVDKELWLAAATGACTGVGVMIPMALDESLAWSALLMFPAFVGAVIGLLVGVVAVGGGRYAIRTDRVWPAGSRRSWKHRFAVCTTGAVTLAVGGILCWVVTVTKDVSAGMSVPLIGLAVIAAWTYTCAYFLAPAWTRNDR